MSPAKSTCPQKPEILKGFQLVLTRNQLILSGQFGDFLGQRLYVAANVLRGFNPHPARDGKEVIGGRDGVRDAFGKETQVDFPQERQERTIGTEPDRRMG